MPSRCALFFALVQQLNGLYPNLLQVGDSDRTEEGEEGDAGEVGGGDAFLERWGWIDAIRSVGDTTHERWTDIWRQPMAETLTILAYIADRNKRDERELQKQMRRNGR